MTDPKKYTGYEGRLISAAQAEKITQPHQSREKEIMGRGENFVKAEFFGIHTFNDLMKLHGDNCVGFRVYYGIGEEDDNSEESAEKTGSKKPTSRLVIVPVGANGKDLVPTGRFGGLKDMPAATEVMVGGPICPRQC